MPNLPPLVRMKDSGIAPIHVQGQIYEIMPRYSHDLVEIKNPDGEVRFITDLQCANREFDLSTRHALCESIVKLFDLDRDFGSEA